ncbi:solute carrier organic anion transporter family member 4A1-like [Oculina patagonica]
MAVIEDKQLSLSYGWLRFRPTWLQFLNTPKWFLFFLSQYFFTQSIVVNGVYPGSISTIEKRFGFSSYMMGMVTSSYDIAAMILTPLISYIGGSRKKPVFCAWGVFTMGVGFFIFMLPHFVSPPYEAGVIMNSTLSVSDSGLCAANRTDFGGKSDCEEEAAGGNTLYYALFILGMVVAGAGCTPMFALGIPYMDENVSAKVSPLYVGIFVAGGIAGAAVGFVLLSKFLAMFVEPGVQTSLTMLDKRWVGNWWLGFAIFGAICVFWSIWLLGFPKEFPLTKKQQEKELCEVKSATKASKDEEAEEEKEEVSYSKLKDLPKATKLVFSRLPFVFITLGACLEHFNISTSGAFVPKVIETQFYVSPGKASLLYGVIAVPCAFVGNLLGAYINKRLKLGLTGSARMSFIVAVFGLVATCFLYIKCDTPNIAGVNAPYLNSSNPVQLSSPCNQACNCTAQSYAPVCGGPLTYFSPCHAGCSKVNKTNKGSSSYFNCACVTRTGKTSGKAKKGSCYVDCGLNFVLFMAILALMPLMTFMNHTPAYIVTLRSVPPGQRSYALGLQMDLIRVFGSIPGPIVFGALLDKTCILWNKKCGRKGHCLEYDHDGLALVVVSVFATCKLITVICFFLSWFFCQRLQAKEKKKDVTNEGEGEGRASTVVNEKEFLYNQETAM